MEQLYCISPLDSRYSKSIEELQKYFSYESWIKYRVRFELLYFKFLYTTLSDDKEVGNTTKWNISSNNLERFVNQEINVTEILDIEKHIYHDIKSIELYLKRKYSEMDIGNTFHSELIHFGLTSQDVNSVAFSLQLKHSVETVLNSKISEVISLLKKKTNNWDSIVIPAYTHGQVALPTLLNKELDVFIDRINYSFNKLKEFNYYTKIGGAVGTLAAHYYCYPNIDWNSKLDSFCESIGLKRWSNTTQITNYEDIIEVSQIIIRVNNVLIDLCQDIWLYIGKGYFILHKENDDQVGSSTMPQKVNPINFENAEANLKLANNGFTFICNKLPVSRLQRDLTDSTILRNYGIYLGHSLLSYNNIIKGINKLEPNLDKIKNDLDSNPQILSEGIQSLLRVNNVSNAYDLIRVQTQNKNFENLEDFKSKIIENLPHELKADSENRDSIINKINDLNFNNYLGKYNK